jgi:hypothetical protein
VDTRKVTDELAELAMAPKSEQKTSAPDESVAAQPPQPAIRERKPYVAPDKLPASAALTDYEERFSTRQRGGYWCIPCSVEMALRFEGFDVTQEKIILAYSRRFGNQSLVSLRGRPTPINISGMSEEQILAAAKNAALHRANFVTMSQAAATIVDLKSRGLEFKQAVAPSVAEFTAQLKHAIANDWTFLMAISNPDGNFHIMPVVAYDGDKVTAYDPIPGKFITKPVAQFYPNRDYLMLRPVQQAR